MAESFTTGSETLTSQINTILTEEANRIGKDIYTNTLHTSPWLDLTKQSNFPDEMGYRLTTLIYDRTVPTTDTAGDTAGVTWADVATLQADANQFNTSLAGGDQPLKDAVDTFAGASGNASSSDIRSFVRFSRKMKSYSLRKAILESPRISVDDLRYAVHRTEQLRAVLDNMTESVRYSWENRYRDEYDRVCGKFVPCMATGTKAYSIVDLSAGTAFEGLQTEQVDFNNDFDSSGVDVDKTPDAHVSNKVLDKFYMELVRLSAGKEAYGRENGRPVFALVLSSEASYFLQTEAGFRDDVRYNESRVSDLIAPLGVEKAFRGFYHLIDDLAPRYTITAGTATRVLPYVVASGITAPNPAYEAADYEAAYIMHPEVCESQVPTTFSGANGISFDPINYRGDFRWTNIKHETINPDGDRGFFRGILASATKPIKTEYGYVIVFKRTSVTPAA